MSTQPIPKFSIDTKAFITQITGLFQGLVNDVASPEFQSFITTATNDAAQLGIMVAHGADADLVQEARDALEARGETILEVPGLIAANKQSQFIEVLTSFATTAEGIAFNIARAYLGLPPAPASA